LRPSGGLQLPDDPEKLSAYECGFNAFRRRAHEKFDVPVLPVALLFIISV